MTLKRVTEQWSCRICSGQMRGVLAGVTRSRASCVRHSAWHVPGTCPRWRDHDRADMQARVWRACPALAVRVAAIVAPAITTHSRSFSALRSVWIGVQSGIPPVLPASDWNETAIADCLGVPPDADLNHPCRF